MVGNIADLTARYRSDGFAIARGLFDAALLSEVTGEVERVVAQAAAAGEHGQVYFDAEAPGAPVRCVFRIEEQSELLRDLLGSPLLLDLVRTLLEEEPVADGIQYIDKPPYATYRFPYHQDNAYQFYHPPRSLAATLAMDAQGEDSGPLSFLRARTSWTSSRTSRPGCSAPAAGWWTRRTRPATRRWPRPWRRATSWSTTPTSSTARVPT